MLDQDILLSEVFRPRSIDELNLPEHDIRFLKAMAADKRKIRNVLFHGKPGIGKTSAARLLIQDMEMSAVEYDATVNSKIADIKSFVESFVNAVSFDGNYKTIVIHEVDSLKVPVQKYLMGAIENTSNNSRFIMTANDLKKLIEPLQSRVAKIDFNVRVADKDRVIDRLIGRYQGVLAEIGRPLPKEVLTHLVRLYFPDLRTVANEIERELMSARV